MSVAAFAATAMALTAAPLKVTLTEAGTLPSLVTEDQRWETTEMVISGPLNGTDLRFIREMAGVDALWHKTYGKLVNLDISDATLVEGGDSYACAIGTAQSPIWMNARADALPENLFAQTLIETIKLPKSIKGIYSSFNQAYHLTGDIEIPEGVEFLGEWAFAGSAIKHIKLPNSLRDGENKYYFNQSAIGSNAFNGCAKLESIEFPAGVTLLKGSAFFGCVSLTEVTIPTTLTEISSQAFGNCTGITSMNIESSTPPRAGYEAFKGMNYEECVINVPANSAMNFRNADEWNEFAQIREEGAAQIGFTLSTSQDNFDGIAARLDGKTIELTGTSVSLQAYFASRLTLMPSGSYKIDKVEATGATVSNLGDGTYRVVLQEDNAKVNVSYSIVTVKVETMATFLNGSKIGSLKLKYNGELYDEIDLPVDETVEFVPEAAEGYEFEYVTHVYDGSSDKDDYGSMSYIAREWDVPYGMVFKGVFSDPTSVEGIEADATLIAFDGVALQTLGGMTTIYAADGSVVLATTETNINVENLAKGIYIARNGEATVKFVR